MRLVRPGGEEVHEEERRVRKPENRDEQRGVRQGGEGVVVGAKTDEDDGARLRV